MTLWDRSQARPPYPTFPEKGFTQAPQRYGPPDLRPSGLGPGYSVYSSSHGRNLAGMSSDNFDSDNAEGIETYPNELNALSEADDVMGNGLFDPNLTHGNVHPDAGVFQDHLSLPGYVARDKFYQVSEVKDLTNGGNVMYVPGGAVSFQEGQVETLRAKNLLWEIPPGVSPIPPGQVQKTSIVDAPTATQSVGQENGAARNYTPYYVAAGVGVLAGLIWIGLRGRK